MSIPKLPFLHSDHIIDTSNTILPNLVQRVPKSTSDKLLSKFFDATEFGFDYEKSGIWSPPLQRSVYLSSSGRVFDRTDLLNKLQTLLSTTSRRPSAKRRFKFRVFWCSVGNF